MVLNIISFSEKQLLVPASGEFLNSIYTRFILLTHNQNNKQMCVSWRWVRLWSHNFLIKGMRSEKVKYMYSMSCLKLSLISDMCARVNNGTGESDLLLLALHAYIFIFLALWYTAMIIVLFTLHGSSISVPEWKHNESRSPLVAVLSSWRQSTDCALCRIKGSNWYIAQSNYHTCAVYKMLLVFQ